MTGQDTVTALLAGALSGIDGLLVFLTLHHVWIKPIWDILPAGLVVAGLGGLAFGWAYAEIKTGCRLAPGQRWRSLYWSGPRWRRRLCSGSYIHCWGWLTPAQVLPSLT